MFLVLREESPRGGKRREEQSRTREKKQPGFPRGESGGQGTGRLRGNGNEGLGHHGERSWKLGSSLSIKRKGGESKKLWVCLHTQPNWKITS